MKTAGVSGRSAFLRPTDPFAFLQFCIKGPGARASQKRSDLSFSLLIKFKPLIRWETVFFVPLTSSLFALRICHPGNFPLLGKGSLWAFEVGWEEIRRPRQASLHAKDPGGTPVKPSVHLSVHQSAAVSAAEMEHYGAFVALPNSFCVMCPRMSVASLLKACYSAEDTFLMWLVYGQSPKRFWTGFSSY